jgi:large repetitive protein
LTASFGKVDVEEDENSPLCRNTRGRAHGLSRRRGRRILAIVVVALVFFAGAPLAHAVLEPTVSITSVSAAEGNSGTTAFTFTVTLSHAALVETTIGYEIDNGSAATPADYTDASDDIVFAPLEDTKTITVQVVGDTADEVDEEFTVALTPDANALCAGGDCSGTGTIQDDDGPTIQFASANVSVVEGDSGSVDAEFNVTLSSQSVQTVTVDYATANGTAAQPGDYTAVTTTALTFNPGVTSQTVTVHVNGDTTNEANETFLVNLSNASNATIAGNQAAGTITDDDGEPALSINDVAVNEGTGTNHAVFTVTLLPASGQTVTVHYATADGSATAGDYDGSNGDLTFTPGDTSEPISIAIGNDSTDEADETFTVTLSSAVNAALSKSTGTATITDNDGPSISINDVTVTEGSTTANATFTVTLSAASPEQVTVVYATSDGSAAATSDYTYTTDTLTFVPSDTTETITVPVMGDSTDETDETFTVTLTSPTNATCVGGDCTATGTIDDDDGPTISIADAQLTEGNTGTSNMTFTVTLSASSDQQVTVQYATADGTAAQPGDYTQATGTVTFVPTDRSETFTVPIVGDTTDENNENFTVALTNPTEANCDVSLGADCNANATILDNDGATTITINDVTTTEGAGGTTNAVFTVTLAPASALQVTVDYTTADGNAAQPGDYTQTSDTLTFVAGDVTEQITVPIVGDSIDEIDETFSVVLSNPTNATCTGGDCTGTGTIDDDDGPTISISDPTVTEGNSGTVTAAFTVSLSQPSAQDVQVTYATQDVTAVAPGDYTATSGPVTIPAGFNSIAVNVTVNGDTTDEIDETFTVDLTNPINGTISDAQGTGTITDDDNAPTVSFSSATYTIGEAAGTATVTVNLSAASGKPVTVAYATADGTATQPGDYTTSSGTLTFAPGDVSETFMVSIINDSLAEASESLSVTLSSPSNTSISGTNPATVTITDDGDANPSISINDVTVNEGNSGTVAATFTVQLSGASGKTVTVDYATANGTATQPGDYTAVTTTTLTFNPGVTSRTVAVQVKGDTLHESNETLTLNLTNAGNATCTGGDCVGVATITDDDSAPALSIGDVTVIEGSSGTTGATFTVSLSAASGQTVKVDYATADGTATQPTDYTFASGTLTFVAGDVTEQLTVAVAGDTSAETSEAFVVNLSNATNAGISDPQATGTITDDDSGGGGGGGGGGGATTTTAPTTTTTTPATDSAARLAGEDRIATSIAISRDTYPDVAAAAVGAAGPALSVVLARSDDYPDALAGTPLAVAKHAPMLLTTGAALDSRTEAEIRRVLGASGTIYVLGGGGAIRSTVSDRLTALGYQVTRFGGTDRFGTATIIADQGLGNPLTLLLATGTNFPDALAGGAAAAAADGAVLLTNGSSAASATTTYLARHTGRTVFAVGGAAAAAYPNASPIVGADRFETSTKLAARFFAGPTIVAVANGANYPDALSGGAHIGTAGGPLLLVLPTSLPPFTGAYLEENAKTIGSAVVYGGSSAVSDSVRSAVQNAIT